jgi:CheY-like chemotaxis protein
MRVLIVDDDFRRHYALKKRLVGIAGRVDSVYRSCKAQEALAEADYDVVFLDFDLEQEVGEPWEWWDDYMENNGLLVARWLAEHPEHCPARVVVHSLNEHGAAAMRDTVRAAVPGAVCTLEPWCWDAGYKGMLWEELEMLVAAGVEEGEEVAR